VLQRLEKEIIWRVKITLPLASFEVTGGRKGTLGGTSPNDAWTVPGGGYYRHDSLLAFYRVKRQDLSVSWRLRR
jgi:hypothetical protein